MTIKEIVKRRLVHDTEGYDRIAIYGTGTEAERVIGLLDDNTRTKIVGIIDKDDSEWICKDFLGYKVCRTEDIDSSLQLILIANNRYKKEIEERLKKDKNVYGVEIVSLYDFTNYKVRDNSVEDKALFVEYLEKTKQQDKEFFVTYSEEVYKEEDGDPKLIAWYLPQFYPIDTNDEIYGPGFTEWSNSSRSTPLFAGHYQPQIPYHVGYYTLNSAEILEKQASLARHYGIYGFCIHYYWFSGEKTMEKPAEILLNHPEININYCFNWATEDWTACWDGGDDRIIYKQEIKKNDSTRFAADILPFFKDERYIKVNGKPLLMIYSLRCLDTKRFKIMIDELRQIMVKEGFPGIYVLLTDRYGDEFDADELGVDGVAEYPVNNHFFINCPKMAPEGYINPYYRGDIYDAENFVHNRLYRRSHKSKNIFYSCFAGFDSTPRHGYKAPIVQNLSPKIYREWLEDQVERNRVSHPECNYTFIGSWNEWAEGSHLEPDYKYGYAYLQASRDAIHNSRKKMGYMNNA